MIHLAIVLHQLDPLRILEIDPSYSRILSKSNRSEKIKIFLSTSVKYNNNIFPRDPLAFRTNVFSRTWSNYANWRNIAALKNHLPFPFTNTRVQHSCTHARTYAFTFASRALMTYDATHLPALFAVRNFNGIIASLSAPTWIKTVFLASCLTVFELTWLTCRDSLRISRFVFLQNHLFLSRIDAHNTHI